MNRLRNNGPRCPASDWLGAQPGESRLICTLVNSKIIVRGGVEQNKHFPLLNTREPW